MYLYATHTDRNWIEREARWANPEPPFGQDVIGRAVKMEIWSSNFTDPGPDFNELRLFMGDGAVFVARVDGY